MATISEPTGQTDEAAPFRIIQLDQGERVPCR